MDSVPESPAAAPRGCVVVTLVPPARGAPSPSLSQGCLTRCQFGEVFFFLSLCAKQQDAFESDALMGPQGDAHAKVMSAHELHQAGVLRGEAGVRAVSGCSGPEQRDVGRPAPCRETKRGRGGEGRWCPRQLPGGGLPTLQPLPAIRTCEPGQSPQPDGTASGLVFCLRLCCLAGPPGQVLGGPGPWVR